MTKAKTILGKVTAREVVNCWLRYALSQPIDLDLGIIGLFILQYIRLSR